jgi:hypothetical protein
MIKRVTHAHLGSVWYFPNQFLGCDFFAASYSKTALIFTQNILILAIVDAGGENIVFGFPKN